MAHAMGNVASSADPEGTQRVGPAYRTVAPFLSGRTLYASDDLQAATWAKENRSTAWLAPILRTPQARWVNSTSDLPSLTRAAKRAQAAGSVLVAVAYNIPDRGCAGGKEGAATPEAYRDFIVGMARALAGTQAVVILEPDAVPADCFSAERGRSLAEATDILTQAKQHVFIDAGHSGWRHSGEIAQRLIDSGITQADGFSVNVASRAALAQAQAYGEELSPLVGGRGFIVDTSRNGQGQVMDESGNVVWCNPPVQGLGTRPSTEPVGHNVAQLWIKNPGESDGNWEGCGDETAYPGLFSPRQARQLISSAPWVSAAQKADLPAMSTLPRAR